MKAVRRNIKIILMLLICMLLIRCDAINRAITTGDNAIEAVTRNAELLTNQSDKWRESLEKTVADLKQYGHTTLANEVQNVVDRSVMGVGIQFRCNVDFLAQRTKILLDNVINALRNKQDFISTSPSLCNSSPPSLNLYLEAYRRTDIIFDGYDLGNKTNDGKGLSLKIVNNDENEIDQSDALSVVTFYQAVINAGGNGLRLDDNSKYLRLYWGDQQLSQIPIIKPKIENRDITVHVPTIKYIPPHTRGDKEYDGNIVINAKAYLELLNNNTQLALRLYMQAVEPEPDNTTAEGTSPVSGEYILYTCEPGSTIQNIMGAASDEIQHTPKEGNHSEIHLQQNLNITSNNGFVKEWIFIGDTSGDEAGFRTSVKTICNDVVIRVKTVQ
ncbi:hypothetical protein GXP67_31010 [Rhodocytophaga rosea]|uniref:Uncharacterized protein n=1 Tax=Rhodocytophaga rosea TaxID=2704465 RepID=A0A6C0GRN8_9BACT|nr:hypothetical protein [Rhodocytophaga rosea]QHT70765.1 hypothetical protein GXP67_31010 [Rhodocytophaga rosea]